MRKILLVDYGSHYFKDVVKCMQELNVGYVIINHDDELTYTKDDICGIILSGSPGRVNNPDDPQLDLRLLDMDVPVLGICYGLQLLMHSLGGKVEALDKRDLGSSKMTMTMMSPLNRKIANPTDVWMAHYDHVTKLAAGFTVYATTPISIAMVGDEKKKLYGIQYHPEATKSKDDMTLFENFIFNICSYKGDGEYSE